MKKVIVFGAGEFGKKWIFGAPEDVCVLAIADNNKHQQTICGYNVIKPQDIVNYDYDSIIICLNDYINLDAFSAMDSIIEQLLSLGVPDEKIELQNIYYDQDDRRIIFLKEYSKYVKKHNLEGAVAECGVMRGHFAHYINSFFDDKTFYMFDTFSGLDERDIKEEHQDIQQYMRTRGNLFLRHGNENISLRRCPNKHNVIIKKGFVPDTFSEIEDKKFCFVNLDMDLYAPTNAALNFFKDKMVKGGLILCHDYYNLTYPGIKAAVEEFALKSNFMKIPVGDNCMAFIALD